jgi:hypothetical protein
MWTRGSSPHALFVPADVTPAPEEPHLYIFYLYSIVGYCPPSENGERSMALPTPTVRSEDEVTVCDGQRSSSVGTVWCSVYQPLLFLLSP